MIIMIFLKEKLCLFVGTRKRCYMIPDTGTTLIFMVPGRLIMGFMKVVEELCHFLMYLARMLRLVAVKKI